MIKKSLFSIVLVIICGTAYSGCGSDATLLNPSFINSLSGGVVPVTPGPASAFVFVRGVNQTASPVEFFVRVERRVPRLDENGNVSIGADGQVVTELAVEKVRLQTGANGLLSDVGTLFPCGESPVVRVGLGDNYLPTDTAARVGVSLAGGASGFGIRVGSLKPLRLDEGNFNCGDTIIYQTFTTSSASGVAIQTFLLPGSEQPSEFSQTNTFANYEAFLEAQALKNSP